MHHTRILAAALCTALCAALLSLPVPTRGQAVAGNPSAQTGAKRAMTLDDGFRLVNIGGAVISPDGRMALYSRGTRDYATDSAKTTWWLAPTDGSAKPHQFIGEAGASNVMWAADSRTLYFMRMVNKVRQLHSLSLDGGEALPLTEFKENEGAWTLDPTGTFFVIRRAEKDSVQEKRKKDGYDEVKVDEGSNGQSAESWSNLWTYDIATKKLARLTKRDWTIGAADISEDGKRIVGLKNVTINEPFFQGHFPGHPIMPGVLIIESMAQVGGMLLMGTFADPSSKVVYFMSLDKIKFRRPVRPGDQLRIECDVIHLRGTTCRMRGVASVDGQVATEAEMSAIVRDR